MVCFACIYCVIIFHSSYCIMTSEFFVALYKRIFEGLVQNAFLNNVGSVFQWHATYFPNTHCHWQNTRSGTYFHPAHCNVCWFSVKSKTGKWILGLVKFVLCCTHLSIMQSSSSPLVIVWPYWWQNPLQLFQVACKNVCKNMMYRM